MSNIENKQARDNVQISRSSLELEEGELLEGALEAFKRYCGPIYSNPDTDFSKASNEEGMAVYMGLVVPICSLMFSHRHCHFLERAIAINQIEGKSEQFSSLLDFLSWVVEKEESSHRKTTGSNPEHMDRETIETITLEETYRLAQGAYYFLRATTAIPYGASSSDVLDRMVNEVVSVSFDHLPTPP